MELITIEATKRTLTGKSAVRKMRKAGTIPGVILDKGKTTLIEFSPKLLIKGYKPSEKKFNLSLDGQVKKVEVKELQINALSREPLHVDFVYTA